MWQSISPERPSNTPQTTHTITNPEQLPRTSPSIPRNLSKTLPPRRRKHAPRQRNPPPINNNPNPPNPRPNNHLSNHNLRHRNPRPQQRSLHRQHPAQRPQDPPGLRSRQQQFDHLRLSQNRPQLRAIPRRLIRRCPHQPTKPTRPPQRSHNPLSPVRRLSLDDHSASSTPPKPARLKPLRQPLHLPANPAQPPIQQHRQRLAQKPPQTPATHRSAQGADHDRQVSIRGRGCG